MIEHKTVQAEKSQKFRLNSVFHFLAQPQNNRAILISAFIVYWRFKPLPTADRLTR